MASKPMGHEITDAQWNEADSHVGNDRCTDPGEAWCVLDAVENEEDPVDALQQYRHWHSPAGRRQQAGEAP